YVPISNPVILEPFPDIYPRLDIRDFYGNETYRPHFDLLIQSYQAMYDRPHKDVRSFYQVAGIHGLPYEPYDGVTGVHEYNSSGWGKDRWGGYCHHGDSIFITWHRPYMLLFESILVNEANKIALQYNDNEKGKYVEAAKQLRHPYLDWADEKAIEGVPEIFLIPEIEINTPNGRKKVKNPLKSYTLPVDLSHPLEQGHNPWDKPHYIIPTSVPFTPAGYPTIRYPNANYEDQNDILNASLSVYVSTVFRPGLYQMFHLSEYLPFSTIGTDQSEGTSVPPPPSVFFESAHFASIETTHDAFHLVTGGLGGHMSHATTAAFDPIFFFHHVNIDRLFALWQEVFPNSWVSQNIDALGTYTEEMNAAINENTDLTPFRKTKTEFWKSSDIRYIEKLGYTYPQVTMFKGQDPKILQEYLLNLYKPDPYYGLRFFAKLTIEEGKFIGPYPIRVYVNLKNATSQTPITSPHFAGLVAMWHNINHFHAINNICVIETVDITAAMKRLGIQIEIHNYTQEVNNATYLLNSTACFDIENNITIVPVLINGKGISLKDAGVNKVEVISFEHDKVNPNFLAENTGQYYDGKSF
ncbi:7080_t:CDS:2, partial [Gigaspora rosea]